LGRTTPRKIFIRQRKTASSARGDLCTWLGKTEFAVGKLQECTETGTRDLMRRYQVVIDVGSTIIESALGDEAVQPWRRFLQSCLGRSFGLFTMNLGARGEGSRD
jgi:hypothetical protein